MRFNSTVSARMALSFTTGTLALGTAANAALIESLPLNGTVAADAGTSGVAVNGPTYTADRTGTANAATGFAATWDGNGSDVSVPNGGGLEALQTGTVAFWVQWNGGQRTGPAGGYGAVLARQANGSFSDDVLALTGSDPNSAAVTFQLDNATGFALTGSTPVGDGVWNHVAVTFTPTTESLYVNGALDGTVTGTFDSSNDLGAALTLGGWGGDTYEYSTSSMAGFQVYDEALTGPQVAALAAGGVPEPASAATLAVAGVGLLARRRRPR